MSIIIRLQGLPLEANSVDVRLYFLGLTIPDGGVHIVGGDEGTVFIEFASDEDARQAMARGDGTIKNSNIKLLLSSRTEMQSVIEAAHQKHRQYLQQQQQHHHHHQQQHQQPQQPNIHPPPNHTQNMIQPPQSYLPFGVAPMVPPLLPSHQQPNQQNLLQPQSYLPFGVTSPMGPVLLPSQQQQQHQQHHQTQPQTQLHPQPQQLQPMPYDGDPRMLSQNYHRIIIGVNSGTTNSTTNSNTVENNSNSNNGTIANSNSSARNHSPDNRARMSGMRGGDDKLFANKRCVLAASNIPYRATSKDIIEFLSEFNIKEDCIRRRYNQKGQPTADAKIAFPTPDAAMKAMKMMNKKTLCGRPVFLKPV